jgi:hypothetical protein
MLRVVVCECQERSHLSVVLRSTLAFDVSLVDEFLIILIVHNP